MRVESELIQSLFRVCLPCSIHDQTSRSSLSFQLADLLSLFIGSSYIWIDYKYKIEISKTEKQWNIWIFASEISEISEYGFSLPLLPCECECLWNKQPDLKKMYIVISKLVIYSNFCARLNSQYIHYGRDYWQHCTQFECKTQRSTR